MDFAVSMSLKESVIAVTQVKWFVAIGIANTIEQWAPTLFAGAFLSNRDSAGFALSARLISVIQLLMVSAAAAYSGIYATATRGELEGLASRAVKSLSLLGFPLVVGMFVYAPRILSIFGAEYAALGDLLRILLIGQAINVFLGTFSVILMMRQHAALVAKIFLFACFVQISISIVAVIESSVILLAISSVAGVACHTALSFISFKFYNKIELQFDHAENK